LEHARTGKRFALFGISLGCLLSSYAFMHGGHGQRLLGVVGHADAATFARGFAGEIARYLGGLSVSNLLYGPAFQMLRPVVERQFGRDGLGALYFLRLLHTLGNGGASTDAINPIRYASQVGPNRRVRFLVGEKDGVARVDDARACTAQVPDGACVVKNCLAHGYVQCGPPYEEVVTSYLDAELGDWQD
jgi:hypothetical protein